MSNLNFNEIASLIPVWLQSITDEQTLNTNEELVNKATNVVIYLHPKNEDEIFLQLCALNFLNAAIKIEPFRDILSYDLIKSNAAKMVEVIDGLKNDHISYYFNKEESCLYIKVGDIVFSFHNVPLTGGILKASFANPIIWPGIRLQKIAENLLNYAIKLNEDRIEVKAIIESKASIADNKNAEHQTWSSLENGKDKNTNKEHTTSLSDNSNDIITLPDEKRNIVAKKILSIIRQHCTPDFEGWFDLGRIAPILKDNGIDYSLYGFNKLILFLETIFGDSLQRINAGTMVYLQFPADNKNRLSDITNMSNNEGRNQDVLALLDGVQPGDNVEINTYGILKSGRISIINKQFVQLELKDNRSIRIKCDAISSIESQFFSSIVVPIDLSIASAALKEILVAEGLYSSLTIDTNATITMVESRRIWLTTDDSNTCSCYKGSIIGYNKEKLVKGQRVFAFPSKKKDQAYCVIMEMSYYELFELFERLLTHPNKASDYKRAQILSLLSFIMKRISHSESLQKIKKLKRLLKRIQSSSALSTNDAIEEDIKYDDETEIESPHEGPNEDGSTTDIELNPLDNEKNPAEPLPLPTSEEIFRPELPSIQGPKIVGRIDLSEIRTRKKREEGVVNSTVTKESNDSITINSTDDILPSMGRIIKIGPNFGWIKPYNQEKDLYFNISELVSYAGIVDAPTVGDEVIYTLGRNAQGPIAFCVHKQCSRDIVEELIEKTQRYDPKISARLRKRIEDYDNLNPDAFDNKGGLTYYLKKVGVNPKSSFSPNSVEKLFAENLSSNEYAIAIEYLIDEVEKKDPAKCYNLFLRSSSYARSHKMYDVSKHLIEKALEMFKGESGKMKYFKGLLKTIDTLSKRIEINENTLAESLEISRHSFPFMPTYVRDIILSYKDFNGITPDKDTIRTGLYKEEYIEELKDNIKQNNADDLLYLTMIKLQLSFHPNEYNPKDDLSKFLVNRAKNILATGDDNRYSDVRYLFRLAYHIKTIDKGFDNTVGLYLMTLGDYTASEIDMFMNKGDRSDYKFEDLLKNVLSNGVDNTIELTLLADSNEDIKNRIIREYEKIGKNADSFDEYPSILNEVKKRYDHYSENPAINFMSFITYLQTTAVLLDNDLSVVKNDSVKIGSYVTDFNTGQKYQVLLDAYNNIIQKIDAIIPNLSSHPTEIGYEFILPSLRLLKKNVHSQFVEMEQRVNPTISVEILESVWLEDSNTTELKVEIRNSVDSARNVHINRLKVTGEDLKEDNSINIDIRLSAGEEKLLNIELHLCENAVDEKTAEVVFEIDYDDIYIATDQRISRTSKIDKTINFEIAPFVEIDNKFRQGAGGVELDSGSSMFYGRDIIIRKIQEAILTGTKNQIAIYGQKRSGKSSLLNQIMGQLESDEYHSIICGKFNLQGYAEDQKKKNKKIDPVRWILESIAKSLLAGIRKCGVKTLNKSIVPKFFNEESDPFTALGDFIEHLNNINELQNSHFVIFIDEFTYLYQLIKDGEVKEDFMQRWIAFNERPGNNLQTVVAAQDTLPHFMNESYASNCFNKFSKEPLSYLNKEEALQLIKNPIKDVKFHNHSEELIYDYTSGSAFFIQIFCMRLVDYLNFEKKTTVVGREEIETVAERLCTGTDRLETSTFECLIKEADGSDYIAEDNEKVLKAIAERTRAGGFVNIEELTVDLPLDHLKRVLNNLYARRVISKQGKGYSINVKLFVKWILNN